MITSPIDFYSDMVAVREIMDRIEDIEGLEDPEDEDSLSPEDRHELVALTKLMTILRESGGDEQWRGDSYPTTLISKGYFSTYAEELIRERYDLDGIPEILVIDWEGTARRMRADYASIDIDGTTFYYQ